MKHILIRSSLILCGFAATFATSTSKAGDFADLAAMCAANPACKLELPISAQTKAAYFVVRRDNKVLSVRCDEPDNCRRVFPRGASSPIGDIPAFFAVE